VKDRASPRRQQDPPAKVLIAARVALEAKRLLVHTDLSAVTIRHRLGFSESTNCGKFFEGLEPG
jgi:transcriptional regulator GlxA family with amidase domain